VTDQLRPGPRERLLTAATELTYRFGVGVGVDAILREAGVARASLYQHFGGKDGLIAAVLRASAVDEEARYVAALASGGADPRRRLLAVFDELVSLTTVDGFRGCRYAAAALALVDPDHPAHTEIRRFKQRIHDLLLTELTRLAYPDPEQTAEALLALIDGVLVAATIRPGGAPARAARAAAEQILHIPSDTA
jgi:AcrR family transcriptional regulator